LVGSPKKANDSVDAISKRLQMAWMKIIHDVPLGEQRVAGLILAVFDVCAPSPSQRWCQ
jgi:hypothetical protein